MSYWPGYKTMIVISAVFATLSFLTLLGTGLLWYEGETLAAGAVGIFPVVFGMIALCFYLAAREQRDQLDEDPAHGDGDHERNTSNRPNEEAAEICARAYARLRETNSRPRDAWAHYHSDVA